MRFILMLLLFLHIVTIYQVCLKHCELIINNLLADTPGDEYSLYSFYTLFVNKKQFSSKSTFDCRFAENCS